MESPVTQKILAIATAFLAAPALFSSAAQACISCEYVPEVVRGSQTTNKAMPEAKPSVRQRSHAAEREPGARAAKRSVRSEPDRTEVDTAETTPAAKGSNSDNENSSIAAMAAALDAPTATARTESAARSENSSIAVASIDVGPTAIAQAESKTARGESSSIALAFRDAAEAKPDRSENSSISVASTEVAAPEKAPVAETAKPVAAKAADCKKFVPSVGMIVSVPCE